MFTTLSDDYRVWPKAAGFGVVAGVLIAWTVLPALLLERLDLKLRTPHLTLVYPLAKPPKSVQPPAKPKTAKPSGASAKSKAPFASEHSDPPVSARPGTREWQVHVERGRNLAFDIYAEQSLPILRAYGITLAIDARRPRGETNLYNLGKKTLYRGPVPDNVIVRELSDIPFEPDFEEALHKVERELGGRARVFALYQTDLYNALRSLTEVVLRQESVSLDSVAIARVQLRLLAGTTFAVKLIDYH